MGTQIGWVYSDDFLAHKTGDSHPERPDRLTCIVEALTESGLLAKMEPIPFDAVDAQTLYCVHEPAYVELVKEACAAGMTFIGSPDTPICPRSYDVARLAVGGVLAACRAAMDGHIRRSFCAVRPPGHHAEHDKAMGFCLFNNVAIAAEQLIRNYGLDRVAIVDFDVHHGNGTQHAFEARDDVLFISIHEHPQFLFPGTGFPAESGFGRGRGHTVNIALRPGCGDDEYRQMFEVGIIPRLETFSPQFMLISAGFDAVRGERIANMNLEPQSFGWMTEMLVQVAEKCCEGRLVSVLEGGYEPDSLKQSVVAHVRALFGPAATNS